VDGVAFELPKIWLILKKPVCWRAFIVIYSSIVNHKEKIKSFFYVRVGQPMASQKTLKYVYLFRQYQQ
jgi:hypothetical protein